MPCAECCRFWCSWVSRRARLPPPTTSIRRSRSSTTALLWSTNQLWMPSSSPTTCDASECSTSTPLMPTAVRAGRDATSWAERPISNSLAQRMVAATSARLELASHRTALVASRHLFSGSPEITPVNLIRKCVPASTARSRFRGSTLPIRMRRAMRSRYGPWNTFRAS